MTTPTTVDYASAPTDAAATAADECWRCGYDLRGTPDDRACPECGLLAQRSRQRSDHLADATPSWLLGLSAGAWLVLLAIALAAAWLFAAEAIQMSMVRSGWWNSMQFGRSRGLDWRYHLFMHVPAAGITFASLLLLAGAWLLTRREPGPRGAAAKARRWGIRAAALVPCVAMGLVHGATHRMVTGMAGPMPGSSEWVAYAVVGLLTVGCVPLPALVFYHLRYLAGRVLNPSLAEHCAIVGWGVSLTLLALPALAGLMWLGQTYGGYNWDSKSVWPVVILLTGGVAGLLFALWSGLTMARFGVAFAKARRGALRKWRDADQAEADEPEA